MTVETATGAGPIGIATACILCECNCGILVKLGAENGRRFDRSAATRPIRLEGLHCQKALRLDHYQNAGASACSVRCGAARTAHREIELGHRDHRSRRAARAVRNTTWRDHPLLWRRRSRHLSAVFLRHRRRSARSGRSTGRARSRKRRLVRRGHGLMLGTPVRGNFEHCEVACSSARTRGSRTAFRTRGSRCATSPGPGPLAHWSSIRGVRDGGARRNSTSR